jgi:hypothetical protein
MVPHILKKDWRLLWPIVAALAGVQGFLAVARLEDGVRVFQNALPTVPMSLLEMLAAALVIALVVHQDPIPGTRQDWLVRPIARRDLFLAKLLFVVVLVQGPWFVSDFVQGLLNGFPVGQSGGAAVACAVWVLLTLSLPVLALAAVTATMTETFLGAIGVLAVVIAFLIVPSLTGVVRPAALTGFAWVPSLLREVLWCAAASAALMLQYRWRQTGAARALLAGALLVGPGVAFLPWRTTLHLEQLLTAGSGDASGIALAFAPGDGRFRPAPGQSLDEVPEKPGMGPADVAAENQRRRADGARVVFLPLRLSGLIPESRLLADRSEVRLVGRDGGTVYAGTGEDLELRATSDAAAVHQGIRVPGGVFGRVSAEPLDVEIDYWFTVFRPHGTYALPAQGGDERLPGIGRCATNVDEAGTRVLLQCVQPGERPSCLTAVLEHAPTRERNPEVSLCAPDYTPYPGHTLPDALARFGGRLPFFDPSGLVRYPVGGPQLSQSHVLVTAFRSTDHFFARVVVPGVRLQDWEAQAR